MDIIELAKKCGITVGKSVFGDDIVYHHTAHGATHIYLSELQAFAETIRKDQIEKDDWQPIGTAPKGKRVMVAWKNDFDMWRTAFARYCTVDEIYDEDDEGLYDFQDGWYEDCYEAERLYPLENKPLFWMPMPKKPTGEYNPQPTGETK